MIAHVAFWFVHNKITRFGTFNWSFVDTFLMNKKPMFSLLKSSFPRSSRSTHERCSRERICVNCSEKLRIDSICTNSSECRCSRATSIDRKLVCTSSGSQCYCPWAAAVIDVLYHQLPLTDCSLEERGVISSPNYGHSLCSLSLKSQSLNHHM